MTSFNISCPKGGCPVKKPVIYLYPEKPTDITINLNLNNAKFTCVYPKFTSENTWNVHALQNSEIIIEDRRYPYLYWEANSYVPLNFSKGFIVKDEDAETFLEEKLKIIGLNDKESCDFITYWLPVLQKNKLSLCSFQTEEFFKNYELKIKPKPDSILRVFLSIKKIDKMVDITEQSFPKFERKGFSVIEWGGSSL